MVFIKQGNQTFDPDNGRIPNALKTVTSASRTASKSGGNVGAIVDARIIKTGFDPNTCRSNLQVEYLLKKGDFANARQLFDEMPNRNTVSSNMMISGYVKWGDLATAKEIFNDVIVRNVVTWTILIGRYSKTNQFYEAFKLFADMYRFDTEPDHVTFASLYRDVMIPKL